MFRFYNDKKLILSLSVIWKRCYQIQQVHSKQGYYKYECPPIIASSTYHVCNKHAYIYHSD